ncbi:hypothetical protein P9112_014119 [Eukaryota sp. TZLM1-RC]
MDDGTTLASELSECISELQDCISSFPSVSFLNDADSTPTTPFNLEKLCDNDQRVMDMLVELSKLTHQQASLQSLSAPEPPSIDESKLESSMNQLFDQNKKLSTELETTCSNLVSLTDSTLKSYNEAEEELVVLKDQLSLLQSTKSQLDETLHQRRLISQQQQKGEQLLEEKGEVLELRRQLDEIVAFLPKDLPHDVLEYLELIPQLLSKSLGIHIERFDPLVFKLSLDNIADIEIKMDLDGEIIRSFESSESNLLPPYFINHYLISQRVDFGVACVLFFVSTKLNKIV